MNASALDTAVRTLKDEVTVELATTRSALEEAQRLRFQVYCVERDFLTGQSGTEYDEYDPFSTHVVVRWRQTEEVVGTVRLILPEVRTTNEVFPIEHLCDPLLFNGLPMDTCGEVSRFALAKRATKQVRDVSPAACSLLRLALIQGAILLSANAGHTHWLAVMEPTLLRLLRATGIEFDPLGPEVEYHGIRQPAVLELVPMLSRLAIERPVVWDFLTRSGTLYPASRPRVSQFGQLSVRPARTALATQATYRVNPLRTLPELEGTYSAAR